MLRSGQHPPGGVGHRPPRPAAQARTLLAKAFPWSRAPASVPDAVAKARQAVEQPRQPGAQALPAHGVSVDASVRDPGVLSRPVLLHPARSDSRRSQQRRNVSRVVRGECASMPAAQGCRRPAPRPTPLRSSGGPCDHSVRFRRRVRRQMDLSCARCHRDHLRWNAAKPLSPCRHSGATRIGRRNGNAVPFQPPQTTGSR
jgi:hypothetical protein